MGYMRHHAIIVTCWDRDRLEIVADQAIEIFGRFGISDIVESRINGYCSFLVPPDGSKEGWEDSDRGNTLRAEFVQWLRTDPIGVYCEWCEVMYGDEEGAAGIVNHSGEKANV